MDLRVKQTFCNFNELDLNVYFLSILESVTKVIRTLQETFLILCITRVPIV